MRTDATKTTPPPTVAHASGSEGPNPPSVAPHEGTTEDGPDDLQREGVVEGGLQATRVESQAPSSGAAGETLTSSLDPNPRPQPFSDRDRNGDPRWLSWTQTQRACVIDALWTSAGVTFGLLDQFTESPMTAVGTLGALQGVATESVDHLGCSLRSAARIGSPTIGTEDRRRSTGLGIGLVCGGGSGPDDPPMVRPSWLGAGGYAPAGAVTVPFLEMGPLAGQLPYGADLGSRYQVLG